jgi:hypothetical protein
MNEQYVRMDHELPLIIKKDRACKILAMLSEGKEIRFYLFYH